MGQQGLPELWALVKHSTQLLGWQLQDDLEALGLRALTALDEALPHLGVLPHLGEAGREWAYRTRRQPPWKLGGPCQDGTLLGPKFLPSQDSSRLHTALTSLQRIFFLFQIPNS